MLKTFALRGRELPMTIYGPPGLRDLFGSLRRIFGRLTYECELVELRAGDVLARDGYELRAFAVDHGVSAVGYAFVEEARPGRFDVDVADALGVPPGPERGALQAGEEVRLPGGRVVAPEEVLGPPRPGRKLVVAGDTAPFQGVVEAAAGCRPARPRGDVPRGRARACSRDLALDSGRRGGRRARSRRRAAGAHAPVEPLLGPRRGGGGQGGLSRRRSCRGTSISSSFPSGSAERRNC